MIIAGGTGPNGYVARDCLVVAWPNPQSAICYKTSEMRGGFVVIRVIDA